VSEFNHEFPALVARTFRDLPSEERDVLRAVSLLDSFSVPLATAAAGLDRDACALQLVDRPFVDVTPGAFWPYHLHDLVRTAVRDTDSTSEDHWSPADWRRAAQRALHALGAEFAQHRDDPSRRGLVGCLRQGLRLARDFDLPLGWLVDASYAYVQDFVWEPIEIGSTSMDTPAAALAETLTVVARRQREHRNITADRLHAIIDAALLPHELEELPRYFLAECERDLGNLSASLDGMRAVAEHGNRLAPDAARGLLHLARRLGYFPDVIAAAEGLGFEGKKERTVGEVLWTQGSISLACAALGRGRDEAIAAGQHGEAALCQAQLAFAASFQDGARAAEQIARGSHMLAGANARFAELQVRNAQLLRDCGRVGDLGERAAEVVALAQESGLSSCAAYASLAVCLHSAVLGSSEEITAARAGLRACVRGEEFAYLLEITYFMVGETPPEDLPRARWIDGAEATQARWQQIVWDRRQELRTFRENDQGDLT
jgi:hypothetical protein